ncbi:LexA family protein [Faecalibacillus faecis]|uniref:LexA family protein n=1 Tax=Faecalibacillus faecis TaxID=1982628 RepID=UPI0038648ED3
MLTNKELGEFLENIRKQKKLTLRQVDYLSDVSFSHLSMIEKGSRKALPLTLKELSKVYNIDYIDLLEKAGYIDLAEKEKIEKNTPKDNKKIYMCAVYGEISAGQPNWAEENIEGRLPIDINLMNIVNPEEHFFLRVNGESMNKVIKNGAFALIHKQDTVNNGEIAVVLVNGYNATLKRFSKEGDIIVLTPESTDESIKQQIYTKDTPIKVIGKYVGKMELN